MKRLTENLDTITEEIRTFFSTKDKAREKILPLCREVIRLSSQTIRAVHRQEFDGAKELLKEARRVLGEIDKAAGSSDELRYAGFIRDAQKEYAEAHTTLAMVTCKALPDPEKLGVDPVAYLNGLGEAVGELRRYLLDSIRRGDLSRGEELLIAMDDIYSTLVTMDFPDAVTGGLRHTTDMVRGVLEKTRSDLTLAMRQKQLEDRLKEFEDRVA